ncbi:MAG TPA: glycosyltransferase family 39 protein [Streptosporangiaceae bacterium]|jgi:mannosyltransferase|nr:glycosyltransferase family 39 protein [Streptosporangiaceae bacterium]
MSSPSGPAIIGRAAGAPNAVDDGKRAGELRDYNPGPLWIRALPPVVTMVVMLLGITVPSYWRDEAATLAAVQRPFGDMIRMLGNVDAVHGAYYFLAWFIVRVFGSGELALRLPSAIAMAVAAGFVAAIGRRLVSPQAGLAAGVLFALVPDISLYGTDARSYAMVTAMGAVASYVLVRALGAGHAHQRRWWICYGVSIAVLGILNIFGLLLVVAHAVTMGLRMLKPTGGQSRKALGVRWTLSAGIAIIVVSPLLVLGYLQKGQLSWLVAPGFNGAISVTKLIGPPIMTLAVVIAFVVGVGITLWRARDVRAPEWLTTLPALSVPWLILPPAILLIGSAVTPVYNFRYILFCVPAAVLLGGAGIAALGRIGGTAALILVAVLGLNSQIYYRSPGGHGDDIRQADRIIASQIQPGDQVLYTNPNAEDFGQAYPYGLTKLRNIQLAQQPIPSATLGGTNVSKAVLENRLAHAGRLWIVEIDYSTGVNNYLGGLHYHLLWTWRTSDIWLKLYVRKGSPAYLPDMQARHQLFTTSDGTYGGHGLFRLGRHVHVLSH